MEDATVRFWHRVQEVSSSGDRRVDILFHHWVNDAVVEYFVFPRVERGTIIGCLELGKLEDLR